jgi:hypothetical protein
MRQINRSQPASRISPRGRQRSGLVSPPADPEARSESGVQARNWARTRIGLLTLLIAFAGLPLTAEAADSARVGLRAQGPGAVFETVEAAAIDALSYAHLEETLTERRSLRVGVIQRVENGYAYTAAKRSSASSPLTACSVRYALRSNDVARYIIPPHSGKARIDRYNEEPTRKEKQIVDELDPAHRPLFQLTPSHNIVSYRYGGQTSVLLNLSDLAALNNGARLNDVDSGPPTLDTPSPI